jgi:hypothetical protein
MKKIPTVFDIRSLFSAGGASPPHSSCEAGGDAPSARIFLAQTGMWKIEYRLANIDSRSGV